MPSDSWQDQFLHPDRQNLTELRQQGYAFVDLIIDGVLDRQDQAFVKDDSLPNLEMPFLGRDVQSLLIELRSQILPRALNLHHGGYMGHMDSVPMAVTIWADALIAAMHNNMLSQELSPVFTDLEAQLMSWFGKFFGLGEQSFGTLVAGGSLANITALLVARNHKLPQIKNTGVAHKLVAFVSQAAHNSFEKGMNVIGLGRENLIRIPTSDRGEIDLEQLEIEIQLARQQGKIPFFVAAIAGTTITGAVDPISQVAQIAKKHECWFHVDAAYGGAAQFSPQWKHLLAGCELADSLTFNPQKWMWVARTCAMLLVSDRTCLIDTFDQDLPYMATNQLNFGNLTLQGTRRTDSLKLWLAMQSVGLQGYAQLIDRSMNQTAQLQTWFEQQPDLELVCQPTMNIICLRSTDPQVDNATLRQQWIDIGKLWLSLPLWKGDRILKAVVLHPYAQTFK